MPGRPKLKGRGSTRRWRNLRLFLFAAGASTIDVETDRMRGVRIVRAGQWLALVAAVVALSMSGISWVRGAPARARLAESRDWPSAAAVVTRGARWCSEGGQWVKRNVKDRSLCVDYTYQVGDKIFEEANATVWQHFGSHSPDSDNQYVLDAFRSGATLAVRYDPKTPDRSVVRPKGANTDVWDSSLLWVGIGLAFWPWLLLTLALFFRLRRESLSAPPSPSRVPS